MQLRLLLTETCNRTCKGCCNKEHDLTALPVVQSFAGYESIMITGGEPMLFPRLLKRTIQRIREEAPGTPIYVYTAWRENYLDLLDLICTWVSGITLTLHTRKDVASFEKLNEALHYWEVTGRSLRLNVFRGIGLEGIDLSLWQVKRDMVWIKDCPVPENEVFMRLEGE